MKKWEEYATMDEAIDDYIEKMAAYGKQLSRTEARKAIEKKIPLESKYQTKILEYLRSLPECIDTWKESAGAYASSNGTPDVTALMKPGGIYFGFEVKRPLLGKLSEIQRARIQKITEGGGHAYQVVTVDDVRRILIREGIINENK